MAELETTPATQNHYLQKNPLSSSAKAGFPFFMHQIGL